MNICLIIISAYCIIPRDFSVCDYVSSAHAVHLRPISVGFGVSYKIMPFTILKALYTTYQPACLEKAGHIYQEKYCQVHFDCQDCWDNPASQARRVFGYEYIKPNQTPRLLSISWLSSTSRPSRKLSTLCVLQKRRIHRAHSLQPIQTGNPILSTWPYTQQYASSSHAVFPALLTRGLEDSIWNVSYLVSMRNFIPWKILNLSIFEFDFDKVFIAQVLGRTLVHFMICAMNQWC